jgi:hypothetical protein
MTYPQPAVQDAPRRRKRWPWFAGAAAVIAIVAAIIGGTTGSPKNSAQPPAPSTPAPAITPSGVQVPTDLVGQTLGSATAELTQVGLAYPVIDANTEYSGDTPCSASDTNCVVIDVPNAGATVPQNDHIDLVVSDQPQNTGGSDSGITLGEDTVVYTVTGRRAGTITFMNDSGDISQVTDTTRLPWKKQFTVPAGGEGFLSISAQNAGSGKISCSISINGQVVKQNTSTGTYAIVDCSNG